MAFAEITFSTESLGVIGAVVSALAAAIGVIFRLLISSKDRQADESMKREAALNAALEKRDSAFADALKQIGASLQAANKGVTDAFASAIEQQRSHCAEHNGILKEQIEILLRTKEGSSP